MAQYGSEVLAVELANLLDAARPVPLLRDRVRLGRREVDDRIDQLAKAVRVEVSDHGLDETVGFDLLRAADDLRYAARRAHPIPLSGQVRLPRERASQVATALRDAARR
jgi:hypothetical protein